MDDKQLQGAAKRPLRPRYATQKTGILVICLGLCFILRPSHATAANVGEQNKAIARRAFLEYLNHKDFKSFEGIHTKDFVKHYNNSPAENLTQEMEDAKRQFVSSSDLSFTVNWMIAEGDKVAVCFTAKGTHDGAFHGVPPTGGKYEVSAMTVWRFVDGKIAEEWFFSNDLDLYRQVGLFKNAGQARDRPRPPKPSVRGTTCAMRPSLLRSFARVSSATQEDPLSGFPLLSRP